MITTAIDVDGVISNTEAEYKLLAEDLGVPDFVFNSYNAPYKVKTSDGRNFGKVAFFEKFEEVARNARPYFKAQETFREMVSDPRLDVIVVTARPEEYNDMTHKWLSRWGFEGFRDLVNTKQKHQTQATVLIDDGPKYVEKFLENGKMGVLMNRQYNKEGEFPYRVNDLAEFYELLKQTIQ